MKNNPEFACREFVCRELAIRELAMTGFLLCVFISSPNLAYAKAGSLDPTFGNGGKMVTSIPVQETPFAAALDAALDQAGNVVVVAATNGAGNSASVARFGPSGALDSSFGNMGVAPVPFQLAGEGLAVSIQSNGQIVVGGTTNGEAGASDFALARYNSNGTLDQSFGSGGQVTTGFSPFAAVLQVILLEPNGEIVASGQVIMAGTTPFTTVTGAALARYTSNGEPDASFGSSGTVTLPGVTELTALALRSDSQILFTSNSIGLALDANGNALGTVSGIAAVAHVGSMDFQPNGELVSAIEQATQRDSETSAVLATRTYANGSVDASFSAPLFSFSSGVQFQEFSHSIPLAVSIAPDDKILIGGNSNTDMTQPVFGLARLNSNGSLDAAFGSGGVLTTAFAQAGTVEKLLVQTDGKIVAIGSAGTRLTLARYLGK